VQSLGSSAFVTFVIARFQVIPISDYQRAGLGIFTPLVSEN